MSLEMFLPKLKSILQLILFVIYMHLLFYIQNIQTDSYKEKIVLKVELVNKMFDYDIKEVIERLLNESRNTVKFELRGYNWSASGVKGLEDLLPEKGGRPLKTVIISPWASGSTYLGCLLSSLPGVLYFYEPLANFKNSESHFRANGQATASLLKNLLNCNFFNMSRLDAMKASDSNKTVSGSVYYQDSRMWWYCKESEELCDNPNFREKFCNLFPFQFVKDAHIRLPLLEDIMEDKELNVRVVVVARDPRAIVRSRRLHDPECKRVPCQTHPCPCGDPYLICEDLVSDYAAASRMLQRYPRRVKVLRFEDLALDPVGTVRDLLQFLNLHTMERALEFLLNHSNGWLTTHDAFGWKSDMDFKQIDDMQDTCKEAMDLWGYVPAYNWTHQHSGLFLPIIRYEVKLDNDAYSRKQ